MTAHDVADEPRAVTYPGVQGHDGPAREEVSVGRVTLQTIADRVGVSRMTVSNAFSRPDQLSAELRATILATADELGYVGPDPAARVLARGSSGTVGVLFTQSPGAAFRDPIAAEFFASVAESLAPTGLALALLPTTNEGDLLAARDVPMDAALVYACTVDTTALDWLRRRRLPLVFVDQEAVGPDAATVLVDDRPGARAGAQHLVDLGHRRVAMLTTAYREPPGVAPDPASAGIGHVSRERVEGWMSAFVPAGVDVVAVHMNDNQEADALAAARTALALADRPTGIVCFSDLVAWAVVRVAHELGLRVPQDVSVVGFDDSALARTVAPALTTVRQDLVAKGRSTADAIRNAIAAARQGATGSPEHVLVPTALVVRDSTGPAPG
ncbi:LacI family DNA-binding transcriptional regulator [Cellulomonas composti]|uniref:Transcriptional regulator n=1 Tax=Cellulomonas composti TaxID=266130 RepID=A0A511JEM2_9CELL|nr:LacI family DNA-binding transcriptional regulator [Cellulomonas composti]GEL96376.1 transcriptional regulator [Cellulomonas composti]